LVVFPPLGRILFNSKNEIMKSSQLLILASILFFSCKEESAHSTSANQEKTKATLSIVIQPFEGLPPSTADFVKVKLNEIYSGEVTINEPIPLPKEALNQDRSRYRADSLIRFLNSFAKEDQLIIGLTSKDISMTKGKDPDYGIMGLGFSPGKSCIASTFKLKGDNRLEKLFKLAIHELGHTQGIAQTTTKHCPEKTCIMRDAKGKDHWDELNDFCSKCKPVLIDAGWAFK
jgi:archaemetzincin